MTLDRKQHLHTGPLRCPPHQPRKLHLSLLHLILSTSSRMPLLLTMPNRAGGGRTEPLSWTWTSPHPQQQEARLLSGYPAFVSPPHLPLVPGELDLSPADLLHAAHAECAPVVPSVPDQAVSARSSSADAQMRRLETLRRIGN